jgi:hypothetical protein
MDPCRKESEMMETETCSAKHNYKMRYVEFETVSVHGIRTV